MVWRLLNVLSLFTGAGGLDLGLDAAGFHVAGCVERDLDCRETLALNTEWTIARERNVQNIDPARLLDELGLERGEVTLLAGGPPCQPFSKSGQWVSGQPGRMLDPRAQTLRAYFDILEGALPKVMLLENVKGLVAKPREGSTEEQALELLESALAGINQRHGTAYAPSIVHIDAADYGVPQRRERVFVVAARDGKQLERPKSTHGVDGGPRQAIAWDCLGELDTRKRDPALAVTGTWAALLSSIPEGHNYLHHTPKGKGEPLFGWRRKYWSFLLKLAKDRPSWTIQAQPGPATGPFHWRSRRLSVQEMARLQTFPDSHVFAGGGRAAQRQIGNAVPVAIGELLGLEIRRQLLGHDANRSLTTIPEQRDDCPRPTRPAKVPEQYLRLRGKHDDHPGAGKGPRAVASAAGVASAVT
jgi:DNA (cytosine-5)-methyltransferase 1